MSLSHENEDALPSDDVMEEMLGRATVKSPAPNDICFGRGGYSNRHYGNKVYLELLEKHESAYMNCKRKYQKLLSLCIVHQLRRKVRQKRESLLMRYALSI